MNEYQQTDERHLWVRFCWLFWGLELVVRPLIAVLLPIDLAGDEAYYWEWGQHLDWGYFSKPPGIAWVMAFADWLGGGATWGIRLTACLFGAGSAWLVVLTARRCFGQTVAIWAGLAWILTPANSAIHLILTIDAPLVFFWALALWSSMEWLKSTGKSRTHAGLLALALAGGMISKQMMLIYFPVLVLAMATDSSWRPLLKKKSLWLAGIGGHIGLLPPLIWNARNNWITWQHTLHHFESAPPTLEKRISRFFEFFGAEIGLVTPVLFILILGSGIAILRGWRRAGPELRLLWWMSFPAIIIMFFMTWRQRVNPNWPVVFLIGGTLMACGFYWHTWKTSGSNARNWVKTGVKVSALFTLLTYLTIISLTSGIVRLPGLDPSARMRGWSGMVEEIYLEVSEFQNQGIVGKDFFWATVAHRYLASQMRFYLPDNPRVYRYSPHSEIIASQHDLWETPSTLIGSEAIIVVHGPPELLPDDLKEWFEDIQLLVVMESDSRRKKWRTLSLFHGRNLQYWPEKDTRNAQHR